mmetsp:Transcript_31747/g.109153  ORF Transcript_31747/g.109153 Transcript_31747/m.109153 type:complete len:207 (-) Transcript_31747:1403-2023(-)
MGPLRLRIGLFLPRRLEPPPAASAHGRGVPAHFRVRARFAPRRVGGAGLRRRLGLRRFGVLCGLWGNGILRTPENDCNRLRLAPPPNPRRASLDVHQARRSRRSLTRAVSYLLRLPCFSGARNRRRQAHRLRHAGPRRARRGRGPNRRNGHARAAKRLQAAMTSTPPIVLVKPRGRPYPEGGARARKKAMVTGLPKHAGGRPRRRG